MLACETNHALDVCLPYGIRDDTARFCLGNNDAPKARAVARVRSGGLHTVRLAADRVVQFSTLLTRLLQALIAWHDGAAELLAGAVVRDSGDGGSEFPGL
jgi:hypothetical protein